MQVGDSLLETSVGYLSATGVWCFRARGPGIQEFCRTIWSDAKLRGDGWFYRGPYRSRKDAERHREKFERDFMRARWPDVKVKPGPAISIRQTRTPPECV
jgi:hypothetical protein